jgi:O-antigen ligase
MSSIDNAWNTTPLTVDESAASSSLISAKSVSRAGGESQVYRIFQYVLFLYLFMYVSRLPELLPWFRIGLLMQPILLIGLVMTDQVKVLMKLRSTRWLIATTLWIGICVPFSFWPGGSFAVLIKTVQSLFLVAFILAFVRSLRDVMRGVTIIGLASGAIAILSFVASSQIDNRQGLAGSASLADPNFFALYLLIGGGFLCLVATESRGFLRFLAMALIPLNLAGIARSGSRAGLLTLVTGVIVFLIYGSIKQRTLIISACGVGLLLGVFFLPASIKARFTSLLSAGGAASSSEPERAEEEGFDANRGLTNYQASSEARMQLLRRSLLLTAKNPLFGVGPDQFEGAEAEDAAKQGVKGMWHYTHNTYTQISSECGIPGFIMFTGALIFGYRGLSTLRRKGPTRRIRQMALFMQTTYLMLMVGAFFLSLGYGGLPFVMIGFSEAFKAGVRRYVQETPAPALQPELSVAI